MDSLNTQYSVIIEKILQNYADFLGSDDQLQVELVFDRGDLRFAQQRLRSAPLGASYRKAAYFSKAEILLVGILTTLALSGRVSYQVRLITYNKKTSPPAPLLIKERGK
ncbi:hypothetical protein SD80_005805 [Scytonema tolypothrichoides VB-61278]|nr:hypothetical protein SD80_005805 [Scytonema tolypothrichoides VB-61278]